MMRRGFLFAVLLIALTGAVVFRSPAARISVKPPASDHLPVVADLEVGSS